MSQVFSFGEFRLDRGTGTLLRLGEPVAIRRKVWDALCFLIDRRGTLVSTDELRDAVWGGVRVSEGSLPTLIYELRRVLDDPSAQPRYIETTATRGFRFIAAVEERERDDAAEEFVGRVEEMRQLTAFWSRIAQGERGLAIVAGEAGIGKSELIHRFLGRIARESPLPRVRIGRCVARTGGAEAYLPVFDILDEWNQAERPTSKSSIGALLREHAPHWAGQIAWASGGREVNPLAATEARPERMQREIAAVFEAAAQQRPLVLVFEDLHWADNATVDLLGYLTTRPLRVPLLMMASYRQPEASSTDHPVVSLRLAARDRSIFLSLGQLGEDDVRLCLANVFPGSPSVVDRLVGETTRLSGGNPLFVQALARLLIDRALVRRRGKGWAIAPDCDLAKVGVPSEVEALIEQRLEQLPEPERQLLEAAAVAGDEADAAAVAGGLELEVESVDTELRRQSACGSLVSEVAVSAWPDGTAAGRFRFRHALYREALYRRLPSARRARLHRRVGLAIERGFAAAPQLVTAALANHFEAGGDHPRAADHLERAALQMIDRSAIREARDFFQRALDRLLLLPDGVKRAAQEVRVRTGLGLTAAMVEGLETPAVRENYEAVGRLRHHIRDPEVLFPTLRVFWIFELMRFGYAEMGDLTRQLRAVAEESGNPGFRSLAASMTGTTHCFLGELAEARRQLEASLALCDDPALLPRPHAWVIDPRVESRSMLAWVLWLMGDPNGSRAMWRDAQRLALEGRHESSRGLVLWFRSSLAQLDNDVAATRAAADELQALAAESGMPGWLQIASIVRALADLSEGDPSALENGLSTLAEAEGSPTVVIARAYLLGQLALAYGRRGEAAHGLALVDMALARIAANSARVSEADLLRIRGELLEASGDQAAADAMYGQAIDTASRQQARAFELRAATARVRLRARHNKAKLAAARTQLTEIQAAFPTGSTSHDLTEAGEVLRSHR